MKNSIPLSKRLKSKELVGLLKLDIDLAKVLHVSLDDMRSMIDQLSPAEIEDLLNQSHIQERIQNVLENLPAQHNYEPSEPRIRRVSGSGRSYLVLDSNKRAVIALRDEDDALDMAENRPGWSAMDFSKMYWRDRQRIQNVLRTYVSGSRFEEPVPRATPFREPKDPEYERETLASEVRREVLALKLDPDCQAKLLSALRPYVSQGDREAALDLIFEVGLLLYTVVLDTETGETVEFDTAAEAAQFCKELCEGPDGLLRNEKGQSLGRYRFKTIRAGTQA